VYLLREHLDLMEASFPSGEKAPSNKMSAAAGLENMLVDNGRGGKKRHMCH